VIAKLRKKAFPAIILMNSFSGKQFHCLPEKLLTKAILHSRVIAIFRAVLQLPQIILQNLDKSNFMRTFDMSKYLP
jgi:hypothetical protein